MPKKYYFTAREPEYIEKPGHPPGEGFAGFEISKWHDRIISKHGQDLTHKTKNGYNDPTSVALVLRWLISLKDNITFRAAQASDELNLKYKQIVWDPVTVGRILVDIIRQEDGDKLNAIDRPLVNKSSNRGKVFITYYTPETYLWLIKAYDVMWKRAVRYVSREYTKKAFHIPKEFNPWMDIEQNEDFMIEESYRIRGKRGRHILYLKEEEKLAHV